MYLKQYEMLFYYFMKECPLCGANLAHECGCVTCYACGWAACGRGTGMRNR